MRQHEELLLVNRISVETNTTQFPPGAVQLHNHACAARERIVFVIPFYLFRSVHPVASPSTSHSGYPSPHKPAYPPPPPRTGRSFPHRPAPYSSPPTVDLSKRGYFGSSSGDRASSSRKRDRDDDASRRYSRPPPPPSRPPPARRSRGNRTPDRGSGSRRSDEPAPAKRPRKK